jgi:UDP:flavonoid glycosyltransferase YjiC (YdhE family)
MIVVPYSHDQPDNGARVTRLGAGRMIPRAKYWAERVAKELKILLADEGYSEAATQAAREMARENGVQTACEGLEAVIEQRC